jgi:DNA-binding transcriptional ArsR family regulator
MRAEAALALLLLLPLASASWVAVLFGDYPDVDVSILALLPAPDGTRFSVSNSTASYSGHYGSYTVAATKNAHNITLALYGEEESKAALQQELEWIGGIAGITPDICPSYSIRDEPDGNYSACNGTIRIYYLPPSQPPPVMLPPPGSHTGGGEVAPEEQGFLARLVSGMDRLAGGIFGPILSALGIKQQPGQGLAAAAGVGVFALLCPALAAILVIIIAAFLLLSIKQAPAPAPLEPEIVKLLSNQTRFGIMQELSMADKVPTHLSEKLGVSKPAIVSHLADLIDAGLVEKIEEPGRKFVHYRLTQKGRQALLRHAA